jgi:signal transduction histidine kinase
MKIIIIILFALFNLPILAQNQEFENLLEKVKKISDPNMPTNKLIIDKLLEVASSENEKNQALYYKSIYYQMVSRYDSAEILLKKTINFYNKINSQFALAKSYKLLGIISYNSKNDFVKGKAYLDSAQKCFEKENNRLEVVACRRHIATIYYYLGNIEESNKILLNISEAYPKGTKEYLDIKDLIVNNYLALNNTKRAYEISKSIPAMYLKIGHMRRYTYSLFILGHLQKKMGLLLDAERNLMLSYQLSIKNNFEENLLDNTRYLGLLYTEKKEYEKAKKYLFEALAISRKNKHKYSETHALSSIGRYYTSVGNFNLGDFYTNESARINDSLYSEDNNKKLAEYEVKYKTAEKEKLLTKAKFENEKKQKYISSLVIGLFSLIGFGLLFWKIKLEKQRTLLREIELENSRKVLKAREIERQRIAKELHDSVGSQLTVVSTSLDNAFFLAENQKLIPQRIESINDEVRLAAQSLRDTIWATHNSSISIQNLNSRIIHYFSKIAENYQNIKFESQQNTFPNTNLNSLQALHIFRIIQEALQNILKHAKATKIFYELNVSSENELIIELKDNGKGFDEKLITINENFGLSNMKNRAAEISAEFSVISVLQKGTEMKLNLKLL